MHSCNIERAECLPEAMLSSVTTLPHYGLMDRARPVVVQCVDVGSGGDEQLRDLVVAPAPPNVQSSVTARTEPKWTKEAYISAE
jgi:hypothetical protein